MPEWFIMCRNAFVANYVKCKNMVRVNGSIFFKGGTTNALCMAR